MNPLEILARHYDPTTELYSLLVTHSHLVAKKACEIADEYQRRRPGASIDRTFLIEAALLHDIGIGRCSAPEILCTGAESYIRHGVIGRELLEREGLPRHALVCERHSGSGISMEEVREERLPLPERDYLPSTLEEKIICVADKFYSKIPDRLWTAKRPVEIYEGLSRWGEETIRRWRRLCDEVMPEAWHPAADSRLPS